MLITHGLLTVGVGVTHKLSTRSRNRKQRETVAYIYNRGLPSSCLVVQQTRDLTQCVWQPTSLPRPHFPPHYHHRTLQRLLMCYTYNTNMRIYTIYVVFICLHIYQCLQTCRLSRMCVTTVSLLSRVCLSRLWMTCLQFACWFVFLFLFFSWYSSASFLCFIKASCSANYKKFLIYDGQPETRVFCESRKR